MKTKYINAEAAKLKVAVETAEAAAQDANNAGFHCFLRGFRTLFDKVIDEMQSADVQEVKHGRWGCAETGYATCRYCNQSIYVGGDVRSETLDIIDNKMFEYCPHCGAKMDLEG